MMKNKILTLSIVVGIVVICLSIVIVSGVTAMKTIRERKSTPQPIVIPSTLIISTITIELDPALLTSIAPPPTTTPSNELVEQVHVRYILTSDKNTANDVLKKLKSGADWNEMCKQYSLDTVRIQTGCDLGWFHRGVMVEELEILAFNAPVGEFKGPEKTIFGWVVIQVLGHEMRPDSESSY